MRISDHLTLQGEHVGRRKLSLAYGKYLHSTTMVAALVLAGHTAADAQERTDQMFDALESYRLEARGGYQS